MNTKIYLSEPRLEYPLKILSSGDKNVLEFETSIEKYLGNNKHVAALNSGTSAIQLALVLAEVAYGDEVLCQSFTFSATANPIVYQGAKPIFIDSEKDTWNMCPFYLEKAILESISRGKKPKAIIFVHLYGMPARIDEISSIAKKYQIILIEDAAEALGSEYKGIKCGTFGDFGVFSFNNNKIITTFGGGALVCENETDKDRAVFLATQAREAAPHYQHSEIGYNYRMSNLLAGIGSEQMEVLDENVELRRGINQFYQEIFKEIEGVSVFREPTKEYHSNHWLSCITINEVTAGFTREALRLQLEKDNIESRPLWKPMHLQPVFNDCEYYGDKVCENLFINGLCLPSGSNLTEADRSRITNSIKKLL
ncbi:pyridoxal phosphate-dependent aminotransferase [Polaribacter sp. ALD11]|uniref:DegT/DnrJ/EryC1/StrS family aminotransferase n=1 Tax=Polaribacter sp. ALD11 TaxID=2058137 RepID=UPI000C30CEF2|nr:aminotransferase class I/II-fold pyridoxal phosphate-dependent enzyme [Polaribacter sp. ALD11]AUC85228.1 pyridoxal phosphate-dependent aminotransferase [Polaribacter sp. ALD11]